MQRTVSRCHPSRISISNSLAITRLLRRKNDTTTSPHNGSPVCQGVQRRQDVDLSVAAQLRALRDYAERNGYLVAREYVDEAESGRIADRPQFRRMLDEASKPEAPFQEIFIRRTQ